jgi:HEAT repeat protein
VRGVLTGGGALDTLDWTTWWEFNKDPFLNLKAHLNDLAPRSGDGSWFLGQGTTSAERESLRPTHEQIRARVLPALRKALEEETSNDIRSACMIALARIGRDEDAEGGAQLEELFRRFLDEPNQEVAETSVAALGILGHERAVLFLGEVLLGSEEVQKKSLRTRAFAAYALGLVGARSDNEDVRRFVVHKLATALETDRSAATDVRVACVLSLGRVPLPRTRKAEAPAGEELPPSASRRAQIDYLLEVLRDEKRSWMVRSHVPTSVARLITVDAGSRWEAARRDAVSELLERMRPGAREPRELHQSCVIALGMLGDNDEDDLDVRIRRTLLELDGSRLDAQSRNLALIALGKIGARAGTGEPASVEEIRSHLLRKLARGREATARWAALGVAILERGLIEAGDIASDSVTSALRSALREAKAPLDVGAFSIACGILRDAGAEEILRAKLGDLREDEARGYAAIGLGMIRASGSRELIRGLLGDSTRRPLLLGQLAISLGLLGDPGVVDDLVSAMRETSSSSVIAVLAEALGRIGDQRSIQPLLDVLGDQDLPDAVRSFAAVALGVMADRDALPWNTLFSVDVNHNAAPVTLYDNQGFGLLNIL